MTSLAFALSYSFSSVLTGLTLAQIVVAKPTYAQIDNFVYDKVSRYLAPEEKRNLANIINGSISSISYYDKALAINPNNVDVLNNKGIVLLKLGKYLEAITILLPHYYRSRHACVRYEIVYDSCI